MGKGIDYGLGRTNIDRETGIRFGVISQHSLSCWAIEDFEADYGEPSCGECGSDAVEYEDEKHGEYDHERGCSDYACEDCERVFDSSDAYGEEARGYTLDGEYQATMGTDGDVFLLKSPYYTHAQFCSPCAPGACHLDNPCDDGARAYAFGHDMFEGKTAPYPVYDVKTGEIVPPPAK